MHGSAEALRAVVAAKPVTNDACLFIPEIRDDVIRSQYEVGTQGMRRSFTDTPFLQAPVIFSQCTWLSPLFTQANFDGNVPRRSPSL